MQEKRTWLFSETYSLVKGLVGREISWQHWSKCCKEIWGDYTSRIVGDIIVEVIALDLCLWAWPEGGKNLVCFFLEWSSDIPERFQAEGCVDMQEPVVVLLNITFRSAFSHHHKPFREFTWKYTEKELVYLLFKNVLVSFLKSEVTGVSFIQVAIFWYLVAAELSHIKWKVLIPYYCTFFSKTLSRTCIWSIKSLCPRVVSGFYYNFQVCLHTFMPWAMEFL